MRRHCSRLLIGIGAVPVRRLPILLAVAALLAAGMAFPETSAAPSLQDIEAMSAQHRYADAHAAAMEALATLTIDPSEEEPAAGRLLFVLVQAFYNAGGVVSGEENLRFDTVVRSSEAAFGARDPRLALVLLPRANLMIYEGRFAEALQMTDRALAIQEGAFGPHSPKLAESVSQLLLLARNLGRDRQAILAARRLVSIFDAQPGPPSAWLAGSLGALSDTYRWVGDYARARDAAERALQIRERVSGPEGADTNMALGSLADAYREMGDFTRARVLYERQARILEREYGAAPEGTLAEALSGLALCLTGLGDYEAARAHAERAIRIGERINGPAGRRMAPYLSALAEVLERSGDDAAALETYRRILAIQERAYGPAPTPMARTLSRLSRLEYAIGDGRTAAEHALRAESIARAHFQDVAQVLSEREALTYEAIRDSGTQALLSILVRADRFPGGPVSPTTAWDLVIRSRALVLDEMARRHRVVTSGERPEVEALSRNLAAAREKLAAVILRGRGSSSAAEHDMEVLRLTEEEERLEWLLGERIPAVHDPIGLKEVAAALPSDSALVGFFRYSLLPPPGPRFAEEQGTENPPESSYLAMILPAGSREPVLVPLGAAAAIDDLVLRWKEGMAAPAAEHPASRERSERRYRDIARPLRTAIWDPVAAHLGGARRVFIVPDGAIQTVSFDTLPKDSGGYLVELNTVLHYLSAERDLVRHAAGAARRGRLLAMGGPDFDAATQARMTASPSEGAPAGTKKAASPVFRSLPPACADFGSVRFSPLPGAASETSSIAALWSSKPGAAPAAVVLTGARATEAAFKEMAPGFQMMHLATHGFFIRDRCQSSISTFLEGSSGTAAPGISPVERDSPLLLAGLAFAGANVRGNVEEGREDGILTAEEIATIDLSGLQWAVLSACDTGLGRVQDGEGVLGIRRAFEVAGAKTLIMSLWMVDDDAAREWMRRLYAGRVRGQSTADAVHKASMGLIEARRAGGRSTHPFYWGAFVAAGDWH